MSMCGRREIRPRREGTRRRKKTPDPFLSSVVLFANGGGFFVVVAGLDVDHLEREQIVALHVFAFAGGAGGDLGEEQEIDGLALLLERGGEAARVLGEEELVGPRMGFPGGGGRGGA